MKELQNNFTTSEQSKRLLELGVPADSADCYYCNEYKYKPNVGPGSIHLTINVRESQHDLSENLFYDDFYIPCWSVGRLIEICLKCSTLEQRQVLFFCNGDDDYYSLIDYVVNVLESGVMTNHIDFSKLEN